MQHFSFCFLVDFSVFFFFSFFFNLLLQQQSKAAIEKNKKLKKTTKQAKTEKLYETVQQNVFGARICKNKSKTKEEKKKPYT